MKHSIIQSAVIAAALLLSASLSYAAESKPGATETKPIGNTKAAEKSVKAKAAKPAARVVLVDINSAGKAELKKLPGIGDAEADKIIAGRPYQSKANLVTHNILPRAVYENLKAQVIARQKQNSPAKPAKK